MSSLFTDLLKLAADMGMIIGPCAGYIVQVHKMHTMKICTGFSTYVSFIIIVSNLIRLFWW
jgi:hypothetical protein